MTGRFIPESYTAPESWASYLVNGDSSGLAPASLAEADAWAATLPGPIVGLEDGESYFTWTHDAQAVTGNLGATVAAYVVHRPASDLEAATWAAQAELDAAGVAMTLAEDAHAAALEARNALDRSAPSGLVMDAQAALDAARRAFDAADARESRAHAAYRAALAAETAEAARLEAQAALAEAPDLEARNLAQVAGAGRGWAILAEASGRRYFLGAVHFMAEAETWARAWAEAYPRAGGAFFVADLRDAGGMSCNGDSVAFLDSFPGGRPAIGREAPAWAVYAQARLAGRLVTVARGWALGGTPLGLLDVTAETWTARQVETWPSLERAALVRLEAGQVAQVALALPAPGDGAEAGGLVAAMGQARAALEVRQ